MLRFIYFVSLLLCLSLSEEEILRPNKRRLRSCYRSGKINRKRENFKSFDDNESMDYIDVASFIQNPDDISFDGNRGSDSRIPLSNDDEDSIANLDFARDRSQHYINLKSDNIPEVNIYSDRRVPQYLSRRGRPSEEINSEQLFKTNEIKSANINNNILFNNNLRQRHPQKKCALKNMKIPFFSRDKVSTTKTKKNKKRRLFNFHNAKKNSTKVTTNSINKELTDKRQSIKLNKRSNLETICPACKQRIMIDPEHFWDKLKKPADNKIHNSRQYYQYKHTEEAKRENEIPLNSFGIEKPDQSADNRDSNDNGKRWKRNDELLIKKDKINMKS